MLALEAIYPCNPLDSRMQEGKSQGEGFYRKVPYEVSQSGTDQYLLYRTDEIFNPWNNSIGRLMFCPSWPLPLRVNTSNPNSWLRRSRSNYINRSHSSQNSLFSARSTVSIVSFLPPLSSSLSLPCLRLSPSTRGFIGSADSSWYHYLATTPGLNVNGESETPRFELLEQHKKARSRLRNLDYLVLHSPPTIKTAIDITNRYASMISIPLIPQERHIIRVVISREEIGEFSFFKEWPLTTLVPQDLCRPAPAFLIE